MHSLSELKALFLQMGHAIKEFTGWYLVQGKNRYTMMDDRYYVNGEPIKTKELIAIAKQPPKVKAEKKPKPELQVKAASETKTKKKSVKKRTAAKKKTPTKKTEKKKTIKKK